MSSRPTWSEEFPGLSGLLHGEPCFKKPKEKKKCLWELETWLFERIWVQFLAPCGSSESSVTPAPGNPIPPESHLQNTRQAHGIHTYMQAKH